MSSEQPTQSIALANATWCTLRCSHRTRGSALVARKWRNHRKPAYDRVFFTRARAERRPRRPARARPFPYDLPINGSRPWSTAAWFFH